jgi:hypothetical protein
MYIRLFRILVIVALMLACCFTSVKISRTNPQCRVLFGSCLDNGCDLTGGECADGPCIWVHRVVPEPK